MQLGIFAKTFARTSLEENLDAVRDYGFRCVQYNLVCAGVPTLPELIDPVLCDRIRLAFADRDLSMAAVSGTFNVIDPNLERRQLGFRRLRTLAEACHRLGTSVITICTGTCDPDNMWRRHPDNNEPETWIELLRAMRNVATIGEQFGVTMALEPEVNNVVDTASKARRLLDEVASPRLKVILDGANLFHAGDLPRMQEILGEAMELLGPDIVLAHAKDLNHDGDAGDVPAGTGLLDYDFYLARLRATGFCGPLIMHGLTEDQVPACAVFLRRKLSAAETRSLEM
ncbi:MAG: sugar phosphate isomerase/epimerase family protein [Pirellulaceae bacterium]